MKDKAVTIKQDNNLEIIPLDDLRQALVFDEQNDPYRIQLRNIDTGETLAFFNYGQDNGGDDFGLEGLSFSVSPQHNYLIVKEVQNGISLDILYASVYCLKQPIVSSEFMRSQTGSRPYQSHFTSHHFLTLLFSTDEHENTLWVHGQQIDQLTTIDVYRYGGWQTTDQENVFTPKLFIENTYPAVALESTLRDREFTASLSGHDVVNTLDKVSEDNDKKLCKLSLDGLLPLNIDVMRLTLGVYDTFATLELRHSFIGSRLFNSELQALKAKVELLGMHCQLLAVNPSHKKPVSLLFVYAPIANNPVFNHQSIELMNQLAQQHLAVYDGFQLSATHQQTSIPPITWQTQANVSYGYYKQLAALLMANSLRVAHFDSAFNRLMMKHKIHGLWETFNTSQQKSIDSMSLVLSQFDDYDKTDEEVIHAAQHIFFPEHG